MGRDVDGFMAFVWGLAWRSVGSIYLVWVHFAEELVNDIYSTAYEHEERARICLILILMLKKGRQTSFRGNPSSRS